jgi:GTP-binding protein YchF
MGFSSGIIGLPNVGKSSLFNALASSHVHVADFPFTTIDQNVGVVPVPDVRLERLADVFKPPKVVPTSIEFVDIAGLVKGASKGEGLGNQFLGHIREVDALTHVVRCFKNDNVVHVYNEVDPIRDMEIVEAELIIKDLETVDKRLHETEKHAKSGEKKYQTQIEFYSGLRRTLSEGRPLSQTHLKEEEVLLLHDLHLLTDKPVMYLANVDEEGLSKTSEWVNLVIEKGKKAGSPVLVVCAKLESELAELELEERLAFLRDLGLEESGLTKIIRGGYGLLGLITFFTHNEKELHAWTIKRGTKAPQAAGKVHSDFERGFIRAEVMKYSDLIQTGSEHALKEKGLLALHGHDYVVEDGDVIYFRFHV